ncbi:hypothetical protein F5J12DRAFT_786782 [Pisolithus orientalis]|uniref:uncharacterized protein n=1 Tax=Pisolithus orientalis TaxID=936130 RepID=UPI00222583B3|nr:uncharacterized protein F5J12DRAFT_786782 [Pisolithus orientalis]KAI5988844.1 hypothetical protein F5J12DRAFT_786782 [Pisolithus orientalis]
MYRGIAQRSNLIRRHWERFNEVSSPYVSTVQLKMSANGFMSRSRRFGCMSTSSQKWATDMSANEGSAKWVTDVSQQFHEQVEEVWVHEHQLTETGNRYVGQWYHKTRQNTKKTMSSIAPRVQIIHAAHATPIQCASMQSTSKASTLSSLTSIPSSQGQSPLAEEWRNWVCTIGLAQWLMDKAHAKDIDFQFPGCHELKEGGAKCKELHPYFPFMCTVLGKRIPMLDKPVIILGICERASKSQVCAKSTLILELVCTGVEIQGSLPLLLNMTIKEYHTSNSLLYQKIIFNFGTDQKFSQWSTRIKKLGEKLGMYAFKHKIIFITVHSEVTHSDLFAGKGESGEDVAMEFMKCPVRFSPAKHGLWFYTVYVDLWPHGFL